MLEAQKSYRTVLKEEFASRFNLNSRYSLRAFARDIGLASSRLSEVLNEKNGLSRQNAEKIALRLGYSKKEQAIFCDLVDSLHARSEIKKKLAQMRLEQHRSELTYHTLTLDAFQVISEWYHYAILELTYLKDFKSDVSWIAKIFGLSETQVTLAIERLKRLNLLEEKRGKLRAREDFTASPDGVSSEALKNFHKTILEKAQSALYLESVDKRDFSSMIMAMDESKLKEAKNKIREFRRYFCSEMNKPPHKNRVYCLAIQFFNLTKKEEVQ